MGNGGRVHDGRDVTLILELKSQNQSRRSFSPTIVITSLFKTLQ